MALLEAMSSGVAVRRERRGRDRRGLGDAGVLALREMRRLPLRSRANVL